MSRVQQAARCVLRLQQVPVRARSTAAVAQDAAAAEAVTSWDTARSYADIPGPKPLPVIGNAWRFMPVVGNLHGLGFDELVETLHAEYGPVCKLSGMPRPDLLFVNDADTVQSVFRNEGTWPGRKGTHCIEHYFRDVRENYVPSLSVSHGKEWQEFRTAINQVMMQPRNIVQYVEPIDNVAQDFIDRMRLIRTAAGKMPANYTHELGKWALESISYVALDTRLGLLEKTLDPASDAAVMMTAISGVFDGIYDLDIKPSLWKWVATPAYKKFIGSMNVFTGLSSKYVEKAVTRLKTISKEDLEKSNRSVLENLLLNTDDPDKAVSMAMDMLLAGVDTTSAVVSTIMYQLATNPAKQAKLQEELDRVLPDKNVTITKDQMEQLKYVRACVKETMRIMPIIPCNFRDVGKDQVIGGYQVPKGTITVMANVLTHRAEKYFPQGSQFLPERWLPGGGKSSHPFAFLPFGFGPRMCVGKRFANLELESLIAKVFRNFTLEWNKPPAKTKFILMLHFETPLEFTVKDRP
ncbi:probable cytochrome P450 49a1 [Thrips palmi]|uniref:Probable cytochrome P450 49a1 n=1 Tax=Thrips palmi TaxID=161013 RepID=A0A6P9A6G3_THRPL|nr:probable cytochrome P450 49a1 [Thrips palmi]